MSKCIRRVISVACLLWLFGVSGALAQTPVEAQSPLVTAAASAELVRFTAPTKVYEMRLKVYTTTGQLLYDSDFKFGNMLDWALGDQQGQRLADGSYYCLVTARALSGRLSQRRGTIVMQAGQPTLQAAVFAQDIQPPKSLADIDLADLMLLAGKGGAVPLTTLAHDGEQGRLVSGTGGLSFRLGDFFAGKDIEYMRLTPEGQLGIGTATPQAKLDVAGLIRTSEGIVFPDGTIQTTAFVASGRSISERVGMQREIQGRSITESGEVVDKGKLLAPAGTQNRIAKFAANGVDLSDSIIFESGSNIGIGTTSPTESIHTTGNIKLGSSISGTIKATRELELRQDYTPTPPEVHYGSTILRMRSVNSNHGVLFETTGPDLVDFTLKGSGSITTGNLRLEGRHNILGMGTCCTFTNTAPEWELGEGGNPTFVVAQHGDSLFRHGNVGIGLGIGTSTDYNVIPQAKLHVKGNVKLDDGNVGIGLGDGISPTQKLHVNGNVKVDNGNVGIGLTPAHKLHVDGNLIIKAAPDRIIGIDGLSSLPPLSTVHFQFGGDDDNEIANTLGQRAIFKAYHGVTIQNRLLPGEPNGPALIVKGHSSQDILQWHNNSGNILGVFKYGGTVGIGTSSPTASNKLHVEGGSSTAVYGKTTATGSYGVKGESTGTAIYGETSGGLQWVAGVHGKTATTNTFGVYGEYTGTQSGIGVYGYANGGTGGYGVRGQASGDGYGIVGTHADLTNGVAGQFNGKVNVSGILSKGGGSFKIDHPLDPANKYLYHSFVESPDMMNIYNGNVTTNAEGEATVSMPDYFAALNRDFRYQLTVIGQFAQAIVAKEIEGGQFVIKTDKPGVKVSWQVTGVRQDAFAEAHRIKVEEEKAEKERGSYLHPELFGQPEEKGVEWARNPELMRQAKAQREKAEAEKDKEKKSN